MTNAVVNNGMKLAEVDTPVTLRKIIIDLTKVVHHPFVYQRKGWRSTGGDERVSIAKTAHRIVGFSDEHQKQEGRSKYKIEFEGKDKSQEKLVFDVVQKHVGHNIYWAAPERLLGGTLRTRAYIFV